LSSTSDVQKPTCGSGVLDCHYLSYAFDPFNCGVHTQAREFAFFHFSVNLSVYPQ